VFLIKLYFKATAERSSAIGARLLQKSI